MKYWFKRKKYGFGWNPASWQGWVVLLIYFFDIYFGVSFFGKHSASKIDTLIAFSPVLVLTTILLFIIIVKT
ncbi:MAG: hypothetical protein ACRDFC_07730, partial [Ignavibacteria bacterium]